jgi:DNA-binding FrmR family transcriptional regulator
MVIYLDKGKIYPKIMQQISAVNRSLGIVINVMVQGLDDHYVNQT